MSMFQFCVLVPFVHALYMLACPQKSECVVALILETD